MEAHILKASCGAVWNQSLSIPPTVPDDHAASRRPQSQGDEFGDTQVIPRDVDW